MSENKTNTRCLNPVNKINPALTHIPEAIASLASKTFGISKLVRVTMWDPFATDPKQKAILIDSWSSLKKNSSNADNSCGLIYILARGPGICRIWSPVIFVGMHYPTPKKYWPCVNLAIARLSDFALLLLDHLLQKMTNAQWVEGCPVAIFWLAPSLLFFFKA